MWHIPKMTALVYCHQIFTVLGMSHSNVTTNIHFDPKKMQRDICCVPEEPVLQCSKLSRSNNKVKTNSWYRKPRALIYACVFRCTMCCTINQKLPIGHRDSVLGLPVPNYVCLITFRPYTETLAIISV